MQFTKCIVPYCPCADFSALYFDIAYPGHNVFNLDRTLFDAEYITETALLRLTSHVGTHTDYISLTSIRHWPSKTVHD